MLPRGRMVRGERYGEYGEFIHPERAGTGNPEPNYGERSVLLNFGNFVEKTSLFAHFISF